MALEQRAFTDAERMELRSHVELAGEAISSYWPMRTFIHHNPSARAWKIFPSLRP